MERTRRLRPAPLAALLLSIAALAQAQAGAVQRDKGQDVEVRFVAYPWRPDIFASFEEGRSPTPPSWAFARLVLQGTFLLGDHRLYPGHHAMILAPKTGTLPMTLELRRIDGREFFADPAVMASPPAGETVYRAPAKFAPGAEPSPVLDLTIASYRGEGSVLTIRYGHRRLALELVRTEP
jgi:hypothetical protein